MTNHVLDLRSIVRSSIIIVLLLATSTALTQEVTPDRPFILAPLPVAPKDWHVSVGLTQVTPPRDITEEILLRVPAFDLHALYGLPSNFYLDGRVISQVVQNHFSLGGRWAHP